MEPRVKPDQHPLKNPDDQTPSPERKSTGTPPPPQSNPDHEVPDLRFESSVAADEGAQSGVQEEPGMENSGTTEDAPGVHGQQQG